MQAADVKAFFEHVGGPLNRAQPALRRHDARRLYAARHAND
jgi:hypothetical protein